ncbi:hypothetical protein HDZ31DRAFT_64070 [Schizophyllum fasciatum]
MSPTASSSTTRSDSAETSATPPDEEFVLPSPSDLLDKGPLEDDDMAKLTLRSLDCMATFYHQQLLWSYEMRLELEGDLPEGGHEDNADDERSARADARWHDRGDGGRSRMHALLSQQNRKRLQQRRAFKMKLECIISPQSAAEAALSRQKRRRGCKRMREYANMLRTLELLAEMRMDSTQRLQYLVRRVNGVEAPTRYP